MSLKPETLTPDTIAQLQTLIQADPALVTQLRSCTDAANSAAVIAKAAAAKGITVSPPDLLAHFEARTATQGAMSDAELEQVAGGAVGSAVLFSIISLGIACATQSIKSAAEKQDCGKGVTTMADW